MRFGLINKCGIGLASLINKLQQWTKINDSKLIMTFE